jgi:hypothetical protein
MSITQEGPSALTTRTAGLLWFVTIAAGIFAEVFVRSRLVIGNDATATAHNILGSEQLFRLGVAADLIGVLAYVGVTLILYLIFRRTSRALAMGQLAFGLGGCFVTAANLPAFSAPIMMLTRLAPLGGMPEPALDLLMLGALKSYSFGYLISLTFFAVQVLLVGVLILASRSYPRLFGWLFLIEAVCNFTYPFLVLIAPALASAVSAYILLPGLPAEGGFAACLVLAGIRRRKGSS